MLAPYKDYEWLGFIPHPKLLVSKSYSCGGAALGFITGIDPKEMLALKGFLPKGVDGNWATPIMVKTLNRLGYKVKKLLKWHHNLRNVEGYYPSITDSHVSLVCFGVNCHEDTWAVFLDNKIYHLNHIYKGIPASEIMVNCPIMDIHLVAPKCDKERYGLL